MGATEVEASRGKGVKSIVLVRGSCPQRTIHQDQVLLRPALHIQHDPHIWGSGGDEKQAWQKEYGVPGKQNMRSREIIKGRTGKTE